MPIVVGDIHGNVEKVKAFLNYRPEELHIALGDYVDSFHEPQERQLEALRLLLDSSAVLLWGNHDFNYHRIPPFFSTGYQFGLEEPYQQLIEDHLNRFKAAYAVDGWLLTHAGVAKWVAGEETDVYALSDMLNDRLAEWMANPHETTEGVFTIGKSRGGSGRYSSGGIFWFDFEREGDRLAVGFKQIFGHTETKKPVVTDTYVSLDTTNDKKNCWLYDTSVNELVRLEIGLNMHEEIIDGVPYKVVGKCKQMDNQPRRICDLPEEEQWQFEEYLRDGCKSTPFVGGYWPADYRRWKFTVTPQYEINRDGDGDLRLTGREKPGPARIPHFICFDCGEKHGRLPVNEGCTCHENTCDICGKLTGVTETRDFGGLKAGWDTKASPEQYRAAWLRDLPVEE